MNEDAADRQGPLHARGHWRDTAGLSHEGSGRQASHRQALFYTRSFTLSTRRQPSRRVTLAAPQWSRRRRKKETITTTTTTTALPRDSDRAADAEQRITSSSYDCDHTHRLFLFLLPGAKDKLPPSRPLHPLLSILIASAHLPFI